VSILLKFAAKHQTSCGKASGESFRWSDLEITGALNRSAIQCSKKFHHMKESQLFSSVDFKLYDPLSASRTYASLTPSIVPVVNSQSSIRESALQEDASITTIHHVPSSSGGWSSDEVDICC
jgi:hypothetical protein